MQLSITGYNLPGCVFPQPDGALMTNVHVAVQIGREPSDLVKADSSKSLWDLDIEAFVREGQLEFRGPLARIDLTGPDGGPRCARVDPPALEWSVPAG